MEDYHFIHENSHRHKIKVLIGLGVFLIFAILIGSFFSAIWYTLTQAIPGVGPLVNALRLDIVKSTPSGLFYAHLIGGIFFIPSPDEVIFYYGLSKGNPVILSFFLAVSGYMLAQGVNYFLGVMLSNVVLHLVSRKKVYKARRYINKYGSYGIFLFTAVPFLPGPLVTFALGVAKYNIPRLFVITFLGKSLTYGIIVILFLLTK